MLLANGQIEEARSAYERAIVCDPRYAGAHFNLGNLRSRAGEFEHALHSYQAAIEIRPNFAEALVAMGNALDSLQRTSEARDSYQRALTINPSDAGIHFNLGILAATAGHHEQAADHIQSAIDLRPDYAEAHHVLGRVFTSLGRLDAAETNLHRALSIVPDSTESEYGLSLVLMARGRFQEALDVTMASLARRPTWMVKAAFADCVAHMGSLPAQPGIRETLSAAITEPWGAPHQLSRAALGLIMADPGIARCVNVANQAWPRRPARAALFSADALIALAADSLLHALLETAPVSTIEFERFLTAARHALLETASGEHPSDPSDVAALSFYAVLARQCFINEYIFDCDDSEQATATACRTTLLKLLDADAAVPPLLLLAVAAYYPLYSLPGARRLLAPNQPGPVGDVLRQQVSEPLEEQALRAGIKCLTAITPGVSERVRDQYEENPYPRWEKLPTQGPALHFNSQLRHSFPLARFTALPDDRQLEMLIAGCGSGSQPIISIKRFQGIRVLAVDLSLSSIAYAIRKTRELGVTSIEYAQADILKLGDIAQTFDVIASVGVLHHLADPFAGWRTLLSRLRPGGLMQLGFYSKLARRQITATREFAAARGYKSTPDDIRRFRREVCAPTPGIDLQWLGQIMDFYSTSECRDLLFHVQEHSLTLGQIESFLLESRLDFLGFELDPHVLRQYQARFTADPAGIDLDNWARFEADNPDTFSSMYVFWVQKPIDSVR